MAISRAGAVSGSLNESYPAHFTDYGVEAARRADSILRAASSYTDPEKVAAACDFGAGFGEPTWSMRQWLGASPRMIALEQNSDKADWIARNQPDIEVVRGDGFSYLRALAAASVKVDLIATFAFGPDSTGEMSRELLRLSQQVMNREGLLILNATDRTAQAALNNCAELGLSHHHLPPQPVIAGVTTYDTLFVPAQDHVAPY